ncbi:MAG: glutamyl-tRNA reductase [Rhodospirillales bacterium]|nr:glutamyl-tRNA reductase [Rhodospirillales bacterium]
MNLVLVGADHRSSTMVLRDRLFLDEQALPGFYARLADAGMTDAFILPTVDRTEIYCATENAPEAAAEIQKLLAANARVSRSDIENQSYILSGADAVKHLFAVAAGLECLVIGDPRFLNQVRKSYDIALHENAAGIVLKPLLQAALNLSDRITRETGIGQRPVSISAAAVEVARNIHGDLARCRGLLIGAGEMGELLGSSFLAAGLTDLNVTHTLETRAESMAGQLNCHAVSFADLQHHLETADIIFTAVNTRRYVLDKEMVAKALRTRRRRPQFLIDTGIPGDIDTDVTSIEDAFFYTLDDLERVTREGRISREQEAENARSMAARAAEEYLAVPGADTPVGDIPQDAHQKALESSNGADSKTARPLLDRLFRPKRDR